MVVVLLVGSYRNDEEDMLSSNWWRYINRMCSNVQGMARFLD
jgi:hypothetical protein